MRLGLKPLISTTYYSTWGYYRNDILLFSGSVEHEKKGKILEADFDLKYNGNKMECKYYPDDSEQIFCPFIRTDNDKRPNERYQSIRLKNIEDVERYIAELVELADTQVSNT